jgi:hypothetical protein
LIRLFGDTICFQEPGIDMRKIRLFDTKPAASRAATVQACYHGPLASVLSDAGTVFRRVEWTTISTAEQQRLARGPVAAQFRFR